ncbi:MAG: alpha/beta hydrolase [Kofleriaceae bacterium]
MKDRLLRGAARLALGTPIVELLARRRAHGLDRQVAGVLALQRLLRLPPLDSMDPVAARRFAAEGLSTLEVAPAAMAEVIDTRARSTGGDVPIRIYVPPAAGPDWIVYLHGGGGVIGSIASSEPVTRLLAAQTGCRVASVDYRLAPEHRHPAGIEDACAAWDAIAARAGAGARMVVAGDSFGGFLAAHVARAAARRPDLQVLIYPLVDLTLTSPSLDRLGEGYLLTRSMIEWFCGHYLHPRDDRRAASPLHWTDLRGAAPALVVTAGFDPLVDEGEAYAAELRAAGTPVRHRRHDALIHGFLSLGGQVRAARRAIDELCADIRELLGRGATVSG